MALVGAAVVGITALSLAKLHSVSVGSMKANTIALQAYQYADAEAQLVRATDYASLVTKSKSDIPNSGGYQSEVTLSSESNYSDTVKQKTATVKIYKTGESTPRIVLDVKRLSKEVSSSAASVPSGTILPWYGNSGSIPEGYALCNGSNGTPDLRNRFLVGAGSSYGLGNVGGANSVTLSKSNLPSDASSSISALLITGLWWDSDYSKLQKPFGDKNNFSKHVILGYTGGQASVDFYFKELDSSLFSGWNSAAIENRPPYYAVYYIMKL